MADSDYEFTRTRVGKGGSFESRFNPDDYKRSGRPGMPGSGDVDTAARNADMAKAAATGEWMSKPAGYYGNDDWNKRRRFLHDKQKKKAMKDGSYEYKDNASGALEKLYDSGIGYDSAIAYGSSRGIKSINSLSDADAIIDQMGRAQGDYTDKKFDELNKNEDEVDKPSEPEAPVELSPVMQAARERVQAFENNAQNVIGSTTDVADAAASSHATAADSGDSQDQQNKATGSFLDKYKFEVGKNLKPSIML